MTKEQVDRRVDRSDVLSVALDKLLLASAAKYQPLTAILADHQGLLVASGVRSGERAERIAGVASLLTSLRRTFSSHDVLAGLSRALFEAPDGERLGVWAFEAGGEELFLGLLYREAPADELARHLVSGVQRILSYSPE